MWDEIIADEWFQKSFRVFYAIQEWGAKINGDTGQNSELELGDMLAEDTRWTTLNDTEKQRVGMFIAHNFPQLAAMCTLPIYIVLDAGRTEERGKKGTYRMAWY